MNTPCKSLGIRIARLVYRGLVTEARDAAGARSTWSVSEARAILGAGRALKRFGVSEGERIAKSVMNWA